MHSQWLLCKHKGPTPRQSLIPSLFVFVMGVLSRLIAKAVDGFYFLYLIIIIIRLLYNMENNARTKISHLLQ